jgi:Uma2 family endonuclease
MATIHLKLGPADHGRALSLDEYESADYEPGFKYEIIDGRLYVSPQPNPPENFLEEWVGLALRLYARANPAVINYVTAKGRVFVHARRQATVPEPDLTAYAGYPRGVPLDEIRWDEQSPVLVVEVLVEGGSEKDLVRNAELYFEVPTIREYWVLDGQEDPNEPTLIQHRRYGKRWVIRSYPYGSTFTTKLLPGFSLVIDPRK